MSKTRLKPYQVWTKIVHTDRWFAIVVECPSDGTNTAKVKTLKTNCYGRKWGRATWKNGAPSRWELVDP